MIQNTLNFKVNFQDININNSFNQDINSQNPEYNFFSSSNLNSISKLEDGTIFKDYYLLSKMPYIKDELIKNRKEKINKTNTRQDKNKIPFSLKQAFSVKKRNKESCSKYFDSSTKMKNDLMIKPHLGRKRKNDNSFSEHNKFSKDNIRRKIKFLVLNYTLEFLNEKIRIAYKGNIGKGINKKELISLDQTTKIDSTIENNKNFIYKTLGDIFSRNISTKYTNYLPNYNNNLIKKLLAEKDEKKREYFKQLFNITFLQCVKWFAGDDSCKELKGFKKFCEIKNKLNDEKKYIDILESYLRRFEENIKKRIGKRGRPKINEKATDFKDHKINSN